MKNREIRITALLALDAVFFLLEIIVGYAVHSLALIADSFHMLNDVFSLIVALWAVKVAKSKGVDSKYTYGWQRAEILGALINGVFLLALCLSIFLEAIQRLLQPEVITNPKLILVVGTCGLLSNIVGLFLFHEHSHDHGGGAHEGFHAIEEHSHSHGHGHSHGDYGSGAGLHASSSYEIEASDPNESNEDQDSVPSDIENSIITEAYTHRRTLSGEGLGEGDDSVDENTGLLSSASTCSCHDSDLCRPIKAFSHRSRRGSTMSQTHVNHFHAQPKGPRKKAKSMNMEGVFLHVMGDALGNIGVMATALFIWKTEYSWKYYMDPIISLVITVIIFSSALPLCKRSSSVLLQGSPQSINTQEVRMDLESLPGVEDIHDLHIWILKEDLFVATLHVAVSLDEEEFMHLAQKIRTCLHGYGIASITVQPEFIPRRHDR